MRVYVITMTILVDFFLFYRIFASDTIVQFATVCKNPSSEQYKICKAWEMRWSEFIGFAFIDRLAANDRLATNDRLAVVHRFFVVI